MEIWIKMRDFCLTTALNQSTQHWHTGSASKRAESTPVCSRVYESPVDWFREAGRIAKTLARRDIINAARNNLQPVVYEVPAVSRETGVPVEGYSDQYVVYPSNWGRVKTYVAPDGSIVTFRSRSKVQHITVDRYEPKSVHTRFIHWTSGTHRYCTLTRVTSVPMLCGLI